MFLCPNKIVVIQVTKSPTSPSTDFDVFVNDQFVGTCLSPENEEFGNILIGSENTDLSIKKENFPYGVDEYKRIRFNSLILNSGTNSITISDVNLPSTSFFINVNIRIYEIKNSELVSPLFVKDMVFSVGMTTTDFSDTFDLACPLPDGLSNLYEFDPEFIVDTGNLNQVFSGSGVHNKKDVAFFFDILDQQLNTIQSNEQLIQNPLVKNITFDILDASGNTINENYFSGKLATSITISELDNERVFGNYTKDFGVRIKVPNSFDGSTFTGEFYAYGNVPNITAAIPSNYGQLDFYGAPEITDKIDVKISLQNALRYIRMDRYDIYAFEEEGVVLPTLTDLDPTVQSGFLYSQKINNIDDAYNITINPVGLEFNTPYFFTIVPYSDLGSGRAITFGPSIFAPEEGGDDLLPLQGSELSLFDGNLFALSKFTSGAINDDSFGLIDVISGQSFSTAKYLIEITDESGFKTSSELKVVLNSDDIFFIEEPINNTGQISYFIEQAGSSFELYASGLSGDASYKFYKTLI
jgi:hypothetical protein